MAACNNINNIFELIISTIRSILKNIREIINSVGAFFVDIIRTLGNAVSNVCKKIPWPFNYLCQLISWIINKIADLIEWIFKEILGGFIKVIQTIYEYLVLIVKWSLWAIGWALRVFALAACYANILGTRKLNICVRIFQDKAGKLPVEINIVRLWLETAADHINSKCGIILNYTIDTITVSDRLYNNNFISGIKSVFSDYFIELSQLSDPCCLTAYVVPDIPGKAGRYIPLANWLLIKKRSDNIHDHACTLLHEIGHASDLLVHSSDPKNLMHSPSGTDITKIQCCMFRTSRFIS